MNALPQHVPVMAAEVVAHLAPPKGGVIVDGTLGGGGHTRKLAECVGPDGLVIALDRDPAAISAAEVNLKGLPVTLVHSNYSDLPEVLEQLEIPKIDGCVLDLGLSSDQLADRDRGFSFDSEGPLDLRFDPLEGEPAWRLLERLSEKNLADLIYEYGEERFSRRIARKIVERRREDPVRTATQLSSLVRRCVPRPRNRRAIDSATRTFQALRIAINDELKWLDVALERIPATLAPNAKLAIISFHSLEDRRVKHGFRNDDRLDVLTKKPIGPTESELEINPRSRSAKLRVACRRDST